MKAKFNKLNTGEFLRMERNKRRWTQIEMCELLSLTQPQYQRMENETAKIPHETFERILNILGYEIQIIPKVIHIENVNK